MLIKHDRRHHAEEKVRIQTILGLRKHIDIQPLESSFNIIHEVMRIVATGKTVCDYYI